MPVIKSISVIFLIVISILLVWAAPTWFISSGIGLSESELFARQIEFRKVLALGLTAMAVLFGLFILYRRLSAIQKNVEMARDLQITDRFTKAVEQLGTYKLEVQLGGIFTLEKIARESEKDHWIIMEILTAYVRENSPIVSRSDKTPEYAQNGQIKRLPTNIQTILSVIGRRNWLESEIAHGQFLNLRKTNLKYADLRNAFLMGVNFRGANLSRSNLSGSNLAGAFLAEANLRAANLINCNFQGADLRRANLAGVKLTGANFADANLEGVNVKGADLTGAILANGNANHLQLSLRYDEETVFPDWLDQKKRDELGMIFELK